VAALALLSLVLPACHGGTAEEVRGERASRTRPASPPPRNVTSEARRGKRVYVAELGTSLSVFPSVFAPHRSNQPFRQFLLAPDLAWAKDVLEIGTGSGVLSFIVLKRGAGRVVATDVNEAAIRNAAWNAEHLGYAGKFEARLVPIDRPDAYSVIGPGERFDLVVSNPPWWDGTPRTMKERAIYDEDYRLLRSLLSGLRDHLRPGGKAWLEYSSYEARAVIAKEAPLCSLVDRTLIENGSYAIIELRAR
jgi:methylase of polypeptide subunit release factors